MKLWNFLKPEKKMELAVWYRKNFGFPFQPPVEKEERRIHLQAKIEDVSEIADLMKQKPNYSVEEKSRE